MKETPRSLALIAASLPPAPRVIPDEVETLLGELAGAVAARWWVLAVAMLAAGAWFLPGAVRQAQLDLRGVQVVAKVEDIDSVLTFPFLPPRQMVRLSFPDAALGTRVVVRVRSPSVHPLRRGDERPLVYDPLDPRHVWLDGWPRPGRWLIGLWLAGALVPVAGRLAGARMAGGRRLAYGHGQPVAAKVQGYGRFLGIYSLELELDVGSGRVVRHEPIAPAEIDRFAPLSQVAVLVYATGRGRQVLCSLGKLEDEE